MSGECEKCGTHVMDGCDCSQIDVLIHVIEQHEETISHLLNSITDLEDRLLDLENT